MKVWKFANCTVKEVDEKTLRMIYEDGHTEDAENNEQNRKALDDGTTPVVITINPDVSEARNIRKKIIQQGSSLMITVTKEASLLGLERGDEIIVTLRRPE